MARVMMIGYGPLPQPGQPYISAPALRTRHLLKPVLEAGHTVNLYTLPLPGTEGPEADVAAMVPEQYEGLSFQRFVNHDGGFAIRMLTEQAAEHQPDAIVGINTYPAYVGAMMGTTVPLWADLNGYWMAEMAGRCWVEQDDARLEAAWAVERAICRRLDRFSAVSRPQLHAVLGEMAGLGRLNRHTFDFQFGTHIPNAYYRWDTPIDGDGGSVDAPVLRGPQVPVDAFIVLWSGGFNVWADVPMLVAAMDALMSRHPEVHFVATGGRIEGVDDKTFNEYASLVDASPHKERYHTLGWVPSDQLPRIYREADVGINVDGRNYETMFGARNRLNAMAAEGLALASTVGSEISEWLLDGEALLAAPLGDAPALAEAIERCVTAREETQVLGERARAIMETDFSYTQTTQSLLAWLEAPALAPDNQVKLERLQEGEMLADVALNALQRQATLFDHHSADAYHRAIVDLTAIRQRWWYRLGKRLR